MMPYTCPEKDYRLFRHMMPVDLPRVLPGFPAFLSSFNVRPFGLKRQGVDRKHKSLANFYRHALWPLLVMEVFYGTFQLGALAAGVSLTVLTFIPFVKYEKGIAKAFSTCEERVI